MFVSKTESRATSFIMYIQSQCPDVCRTNTGTGFGEDKKEKKRGGYTLGAVSSTFGLFSISHNPSLNPFLLLGLAYFSLLGRYGKMSLGPRNALQKKMFVYLILFLLCSIKSGEHMHC